MIAGLIYLSLTRSLRQKMNREQFLNSCKYFHLTPEVENGRIVFSGKTDLKDARKALDELPELEAELILRKALHDSDLLFAIQERACIRWADGYSDSLFMAVLSNIAPTGEVIEFNDTPDEIQVAFLRSMGFPDADIMNREKHPSVWIKQKPRTDWNAELSKYR